MAEVTLNELRADLRSLYAKAVEAVKRQNYDYAVTLLNQILAQEPGLFECHKALRHVQVRKCVGARSGFFKKVLSSAGSSPQIARAKLTLHKHPTEAMAKAETVLNRDPNNPSAHRIIVEAARTLDEGSEIGVETEARLGRGPVAAHRDQDQDKSNAPEVKSALPLVEDDTAAPRNVQTGPDTVLDGGEGSDHSNLETSLRHYDFQISQLDPAESDYAQRVEQIQSEKLAFQLAECQQRADKYPTDLVIRFELGQFYFQAGKISEAIGELQKAQQNPHQRIAALNLLGQCFVRRNMNDLAVRTFENAIKEKSVLDEEKKDLIYNLGCVLEKIAKTAEAVQQFQVIYETDINYRDVAGKVEAHCAKL